MKAERLCKQIRSSGNVLRSMIWLLHSDVKSLKTSQMFAPRKGERQGRSLTDFETISKPDMPFQPGNPRVSRAVKAARRHIRRAGWSYRAAAPVLGCCYQFLAQVLNGRKKSRPLLERVMGLQSRKGGVRQ